MNIKKLKRCNLQSLLDSKETPLGTFEMKRFIDRFGPYYDPTEKELNEVLTLERAWRNFLVKNGFIEIVDGTRSVGPPKVKWKVGEAPTGRFWRKRRF